VIISTRLRSGLRSFLGGPFYGRRPVADQSESRSIQGFRDGRDVQKTGFRGPSRLLAAFVSDPSAFAGVLGATRTDGRDVWVPRRGLGESHIRPDGDGPLRRRKTLGTSDRLDQVRRSGSQRVGARTLGSHKLDSVTTRPHFRVRMRFNSFQGWSGGGRDVRPRNRGFLIPRKVGILRRLPTQLVPGLLRHNER
jgi:hypothetical protein